MALSWVVFDPSVPGVVLIADGSVRDLLAAVRSFITLQGCATEFIALFGYD